MQGERYVVKKNDNLWRIAHETLGSGRQWPRIWRYNNRREVVQVTGRAVPNPDLIYVGQTLLIPRLTGDPTPKANAPAEECALPVAKELGKSSQTTPPDFSSGQQPRTASRSQESLSDQLSRLRLPVAYKYELGELNWPVQNVGAATVRISMSGDVLLASKESYPASLVVAGGKLEAQLQNEANHAFGKLVSDNSFVYDPDTKRVTVKSMLVSQSNTPNKPTAAVGVALDSGTGIPGFRAEIKIPKLEGTVGVFRYTALDVGFTVEVTPNPTAPRPTPVMKPNVESAQPYRRDGISEEIRQSARASANVEMLIGVGIAIGGGALVFGTLAEDFFTFGIGILNDGPTLAMGAAAITTGLAMLRKTPSAQLPRTMSAAKIESISTITLNKY